VQLLDVVVGHHGQAHIARERAQVGQVRGLEREDGEGVGARARRAHLDDATEQGAGGLLGGLPYVVTLVDHAVVPRHPAVHDVDDEAQPQSFPLVHGRDASGVLSHTGSRGRVPVGSTEKQGGGSSH